MLAANVSAGEIASNYNVEVDGINAYTDSVGVIAGDSILVKVFFKADKNDTDVTIEANLEGDKVETNAISKSFDVEAGKSYMKTLSVKVPFELKDEVSNDLFLSLEIDGKEHKTELDEITLRVQRPSYNAVVKSVTTSSSASAGEIIPVDLVLKNQGYNNLDDIYVSVKISALDIEKTSYFGDLVAIESTDDHDDDEKDTVSGRLYLTIPYGVKPGVYTMEVEVKNDDTTSTVVKQITIENDLVNNVIAIASKKTVAVNENAEYTLLIVNPTNKIKVYRVVTESSNGLTSSTEESVIAVPAESSKSVKILASSDKEGEYNFDVNVLSGENLVGTVNFVTEVKGGSDRSLSNPVVILTVILAIVFLVLLIVLIVLIGKKPEKSGELGESYY
ncbi:MAG: hypothetical protein AABW81_03720 [Nanoarchaeota archaeon]